MIEREALAARCDLCGHHKIDHDEDRCGSYIDDTITLCPFLERAAVDRVLAEVEARIDTGRQSHFVEYGNDVPDARGEDWGWTHALDVVEAYRRELSGE